MHDPAASDALPTPEQMRNYFAAAKSAKKARRLREASRAIITGNIAALGCLLGISLVLGHARMFLELDAGLFGYIALAVLSLSWMKRQRLRSSVYVLDQFETQPVPSRRALVFAVLISLFIFFGMSVAFFTTIDVNRLSQTAIIAVLSLGPLAVVGYFACRCVIFRFWEDLLFAVAVALAYLPFPFQAWHLAPLCLLTWPMVIVGTICLHLRWVRWQRSASIQNAETVGEEYHS